MIYELLELKWFNELFTLYILLLFSYYCTSSSNYYYFYINLLYFFLGDFLGLNSSPPFNVNSEVVFLDNMWFSLYNKLLSDFLFVSIGDIKSLVLPLFLWINCNGSTILV